MIKMGKRGDRVTIAAGGWQMIGSEDDPSGLWDSKNGTSGTILERWVVDPSNGKRTVYYDVIPDFPNYGRFSFRAKDLKRLED